MRETVHTLRPMIRPYGLSKVFENATRRVQDDMAQAYAEGLRLELEAWRDARGGQGVFEVDVRLTNIGRAGAFGIVRVRVGEGRPSQAGAVRSDTAVDAVVRGLFDAGLLPLEAQEQIYLAPDTVIVSEDTVYLIKPQTERLWLQRQARRDAERIVMATIEPLHKSQDAA